MPLRSELELGQEDDVCERRTAAAIHVKSDQFREPYCKP